MTHFKGYLVMALLLLFATAVQAAIPQLINYQGLLTTSGGTPVVDGSYSVTFRIYDASSGGSVLWSETKLVTTSSGLFSTLLGSVTPIPDSAFSSASSYLGIKISSDPEISPRQQLASVPYANRVGSLLGSTGPIVIDTSSDTTGLGKSGNGTNAFCPGFNCSTVGTLMPPGYVYIALGDPGAPFRAGLLRMFDNFGCRTILGNGFNGDFSALGKATFGPGHTNAGIYSFVAGACNTVLGFVKYAAIGGGQTNVAGVNAPWGTIGGGQGNNLNSSWGTIGGGQNNSISSGLHSTISGGESNSIVNNIHAAVIGGGSLNTIGDHWSAVGGGYQNTSNSRYGAIGGGQFNDISGFWETIAGGDSNSVPALGVYGALGGGRANTVGDTAGTIGGGNKNTVNGTYGTIAGGDSSLVSATHGTIGGGQGNSVNSTWGTIGGGQNNIITSGLHSTISGGFNNAIVNNIHAAVIGGGESNNVSNHWSAIGGGTQNTAPGRYSIVGGGQSNTAGNPANGAIGWWATVGGGNQNIASGQYSTVPGGSSNTASGDYSLAAGDLAQAAHSNSFVWNDGSAGAWGTTATNQFLIHTGNVGINTNTPGFTLCVNGSIAATSALGVCSDLRYKKNIETLSGALEKVLKLRGVTYNWRTDEFPQMNFSEKTQIGFIAQEIKEVLPEVVMQGSDGYYSVDYGRLTPILVSAIQAQQATIDKLQLKSAEIDQLRTQMAAMSEQLSKLLAAQSKPAGDTKLAANDKSSQTGGK